MGARWYKGVFLVIGVLTLAYMIHVMGVSVIWGHIRATGVYFLPIIGSWVVVYLFNALAFQSIIVEKDRPQSRIPFWQVLRLTISGYAINYVTPFVALGGEPYRILELKPHVGAAKASSSVLLYSIMHMFSHIIFWLLSVVLILVFVPLDGLLLGCCAVIVVLGGGLCLWFSRVYRKGFTQHILATLSRLPWVGGKVATFRQSKQELLTDIDQQIGELYTLRRPVFYRSLWWELAARVVGCAEIYFAALAIGLGMTIEQALIISATSSLFANVLFFFPMQLGTREGGLALAMTSVGLAGGGGVIIGVLTRIREIVWICIGLLLVWRVKGASGRPFVAVAHESKK